LKEGDVVTYFMKDPEEERKVVNNKRQAKVEYLEKCEGMSCLEKCPSKTRIRGSDIVNGDRCNWCVEALHYYLIRVKKGDSNA
jgi:hypothetical protein